MVQWVEPPIAEDYPPEPMFFFAIGWHPTTKMIGTRQFECAILVSQFFGMYQQSEILKIKFIFTYAIKKKPCTDLWKISSLQKTINCSFNVVGLKDLDGITKPCNGGSVGRFSKDFPSIGILMFILEAHHSTRYGDYLIVHKWILNMHYGKMKWK